MNLLLWVTSASLLVCFVTGAILDKLRPEGFADEGQAFWRAFAKNDLDREIKTKLNMKKAKNIIFFLGDGMGVNSLTAARIYKGQKSGRKGEEEELAWEAFPFTGMSKTYNVNRQVPDSAGTATSIFTGVKTNFGVLGIDAIPTPGPTCNPKEIEDHSLPTMLDWFQEDGRDTGIITTDTITNASPGALYAKTSWRMWEADTDIPAENKACMDIAKQMINNNAGSRANLLFGGGLANFLLKKDGGVREDEDLVETFKQRKTGETFATLFNNKDLRDWDQNSKFSLGLFASETMPYHIDRNTSDSGTPSLTEMVSAAIGRLSQNDKGFFLFVEAAKIDKAHHATDAHRALDETVEMELAVRAAINDCNLDLDETLIIVTADHTHSWGISGYPHRGNPILGYNYDEANYLFSQYPDGTKLPYSTINYANGPSYSKHHTDNAAVPWKDLRTMDFNSLDYRQPAMMPGVYGLETHGGSDVAVFGIGPMAHLLSGVHEENYLGTFMAYAACVGDYKDDCHNRNKQTKKH